MDLYLMRWPVISSLLAGVVAIAVIPLGPVSSYVGGVCLICVLVILNIVLVMTFIVQEKKDKVQIFMLSLPVSTTQYTAAKLLANAIAFAGSWVLLTIGVASVIDASDLPNGILPFLLTVLAYLLMYYAVLLAVGLASDSSGWHATVITIGNISVNFLIPWLMSQPSVYLNRNNPTAVWTGDIMAVLAVEIAIAVTALGVGLYVRSRRTDFV
jgi:ABC-type transport system involved in multi-copper enzyme maturation permease subunit